MKNVLVTALVAALGINALDVNAEGAPLIKTKVSTSAKVKVSKAFRDLKPLQKITPQRKTKLKASGEKVPGEDLILEVPNRFPYSSKSHKLKAGDNYVDPVLQKEIKTSRFKSRAPEMGENFEGMTNPQGYLPPDTNGSVGPNHYVQTVNVSVAIWDKEGNQLLAPRAINELWAGFGGRCETLNSGDPIVLYDRRADRWMISQFAIATGDNHQCIAISQTGDPTGSYYLYDFPYGELMNDYPHFGIFGDAYYMGVNQFGGSYAGGGMAAYERDKMLAGAEAKQIIISGEAMNPQPFTPMPLDVDGLAQPPEDMNELFVWAAPDESRLYVYEMDVDWNDVNAATFTEVAALDVSAYAWPNNATQPNGAELDALGVRSMFRTAYRNLNGQGKILFTHNIAGPSGQPVARWYELNVDHSNGHAVTLSQEGTFSPDSELAPSTAARWMASGAIDGSGNIAIGYTVSDENIHPSIHAATRLVTDPAGQLTDEFVLVEGTGSQAEVNRGRWADYASMSIDPVDDCTFWYTNEYYKAENDNTRTWSTYISSFKIPSCTTPPSGVIMGVVTDESSDAPIANATVSAGNISTVTNVNGEYSIELPVGEHDLQVFRYGWETAQRADIAVAADDELTNNFALEATPSVELTGKIIENSASQRALYAKITAAVPGDTIVVYSNPETGEYTLPVFAGTTINVSAEAISNGYQMNSQDVLPVADTKAPMAFDIVLSDNGSCTAPGYAWNTFVEKFETSVFPPEGWSVTDDAGDGVVWGSALAGRGNITGTMGDAALADSDDAGPGSSADTSLISPVINVADIESTTLNFVANYRPLRDAADLDINVDGAGWTNVQALQSGIQTYSIDLSATLSGATSFQLRWRYYNANWAWYISVDDISFGNAQCLTTPGSLVAGYVVDENTDQVLNGASVSVNGEVVTMSSTTAEDVALDDGFVYFFAPQDSEISISANNYAAKSVETTEVTLATPVYLQAGLIETETSAMATTLTQGRTGNESFDISNSGGVAADIKVILINGSPELTYGPFEQGTRHMGPKDLYNKSAEKIRYYPDLSYIEQLAPGELIGAFPASGSWGIARDKDTGEFWLGEDPDLGAAGMALRRYDSQGNPTTDTIDNSFGGFWSGDLAFNQRTGKLWQMNVGGDNCIYEIDTETRMQTGNTICPEFGGPKIGLAYDPVSDTFYAGGWVDSTVHQFTTTGEIVRSVNVGLPMAGLAYNSSTGHLFASLNSKSSEGSFDIVVMDANTQTLVKVGGYDIQFDINGDGNIDDIGTDNGQAGLDIDCNGTLWMNEMNLEYALGIDSNEAGVCDWKPSWASVSASANSVSAGESETIELAFSGNMPVGTHEASVVILNNTPYSATTFPVSLTVNEPQYGTLQFNVTSMEVDENENAVLTVERVGGADYAVSIAYTTVDGSAVAGTDYTATSGTLSWADMDAAAKTITVPTNHLDLHKTFTVVLSDVSGGAAMGSKVAASVTIVDKPAGGGSLGASLLALFALAGFARRRQLKAA